MSRWVWDKNERAYVKRRDDTWGHVIMAAVVIGGLYWAMQPEDRVINLMEVPAPPPPDFIRLN
jgi:hypothetical protein